MADPGSQIETLRERIEESDEISDDDREALLEFSDELFVLQTEYGDHRHLKLLRHSTRMAEHVGGLADALEDRDAAEDTVRSTAPTTTRRPTATTGLPSESSAAGPSTATATIRRRVWGGSPPARRGTTTPRRTPRNRIRRRGRRIGDRAPSSVGWASVGPDLSQRLGEVVGLLDTRPEIVLAVVPC